MTKIAQEKHGYIPDTKERAMRAISRFLIRLLKLDGISRFSNVFIQMLDPVSEVRWMGYKSFRFRTGHGRLWWRAVTFHTEEPMMIGWIKTFNNNDIFLDIGANVGTYTIPGAYMSKLTYACELDPINIGILKENIHLNILHDKVVILPFPANEKCRVTNVYYRDFSKGDALQSMDRESPINTIEGEGKHIAQQLSFPLDKIFSNFSLTAPSKVKIDVDGNEMTVFRGAKKVILQAEEIYFEDCGSQDCKDIIEELVANGFIVANQEIPATSKGSRNILFEKVFLD